MLYYKFKNYEEFKELFGIVKHGNGNKSRKNKILLAFIKNKELLHNAVVSGDYTLLHISDITTMKNTVIEKIIRSGGEDETLSYCVNLIGKTYYSSTYGTDGNKGLCEDGDMKAVRYINYEKGEKIFKMKAGKFYRAIILETAYGKTLPETILNFLCEEFASEWQTYSMGKLPKNKLFVNKDFERIYSSDCCEGDFDSCMVDKEQHSFYENAVNASAAYLENEDGSLRKFDYIVSNPPFKLDFSDYHSDLKTDSYKGRFFAGIPNIPSKNKKGMEIYLCFFQHLLYSLKEDGKAAIVVPTGFITAKSGIAFKIRKHLVDGEKSILRGVVSMPSNIFANTGTNVSVVFIDKSGVDKPVLIDASKLGETIKENGNQKTKLRTEEIQQIVNTFRNKDVVEDFSVTPTFDEIKEKGYSFSAGQYFDIKIDYVDITEDEFNRRMDNFKTTLRQQFRESHRLEEEILKQLECIGFNENVGKENSNE